jgi:hypothetical protein
MPRLTDAIILEQIRNVLENWRYTGYVTAKEVVLDWIAENLGGATLKDLSQAMYQYEQGGGPIDQVAETRSEWSDRPYHYDFRIRCFANRTLYVETILQDDAEDPTLHIVSIHDV